MPDDIAEDYESSGESRTQLPHPAAIDNGNWLGVVGEQDISLFKSRYMVKQAVDLKRQANRR